jgi:hypothetical protein
MPAAMSGSSWQWANCPAASSLTITGGSYAIFYSLADTCGSSTKFRSAFNAYIHGFWHGWKFGTALSC